MSADNHHDGSAMDYAEHDKTFAVFTGLVKWGTVGSLGMALLAGAATNTVPWIFAIVVMVLLVGTVVKFF